MGTDDEPVAAGQVNGLFRILEVNDGPALQHENPLIPGLIVIEAGW
jgi:hypothetical protein